MTFNIHFYSERVKPKIQRVFQTTNSTSVQWMFCLDRVKKFRVICIDGSGKGVDMNARQETQGEVFVGELNNKFLVPETTYHIKVLAEYEDGFESESEPYPFTSPCKYLQTCNKVRHALFFSSPWASY